MRESCGSGFSFWTAGERDTTVRAHSMRLSDRYLGKQVLFGTLFAVLVLNLILVLGRLFKDIQELLVDQRVPLEILFKFVFSVLPYFLMFTLPWGFLTAVLLVFGRLSAGQEITAFRVAGMSLARLSLPVFVIGAMFSGLCLYLNVNVVPLARASIAGLILEQAKKDPRSLLDPGKVQARLKGQKKLFVEGKAGDELLGFHFYQLKEEGQEENGLERAYVHAGKATIKIDEEKRQISLRLMDSFFEAKQADGTVDLGFAGAAEPLILPYDWRPPRTRANSMTNREIREHLKRNPDLDEDKKLSFRTEITRRFSFSMACFSFAFIAVPLGLTSRRRDTSSGLVISLLLGAGYFLITVLSSEFDTDLGATSVLWLPNVLCILIGLFLFRRARFK